MKLDQWMWGEGPLLSLIAPLLLLVNFRRFLNFNFLNFLMWIRFFDNCFCAMQDSLFFSCVCFSVSLGQLVAALSYHHLYIGRTTHGEKRLGNHPMIFWGVCVCVCVCMCLCVCLCVSNRDCMSTLCVHLLACVHVHARAWACIQGCVCVWLCVFCVCLHFNHQCNF